MHSDDPQIEAEKHRLQMEMLLKDADIKKNERLKMALDIELRQLKLKRQQIESDINSKETLFKKIEADLMVLNNEMIKAKHKMGTLR